MLVHQRRARPSRDGGVDQRRELLVFDLDLLGQILGERARLGDAHDHRLAHIAHLARCERGVVGSLEARDARERADRLEAREILGPQRHGRAGRRDVDAADASMRDRAAQEGDLLEARHLDVADVVAAPQQQAGILLAREARADARCRP